MSGAAGAGAGRRRATEVAALNDSLASPVGPSRRGNVPRAVAPPQADPPPAAPPDAQARDAAAPARPLPAGRLQQPPADRESDENDDDDGAATSVNLQGVSTSRLAGNHARHREGAEELVFDRTGVSFKLICIIKHVFVSFFLLFRTCSCDDLLLSRCADKRLRCSICCISAWHVLPRERYPHGQPH